MSSCMHKDTFLKCKTILLKTEIQVSIIIYEDVWMKDMEF